MNNLSGDESPMPPNSLRNGDHVGGFVNSNGVVPGGHLTSELRNLVSILGRQSDNGISLEQLLTGNSPSRNSVTPTQTLSHTFPTTPNSSKSTNWTGGGRKRGRPTETEESAKRRRGSYSTRQSGEKGHSKGLRHFSQRVCEKVRLKGNTTYNEVADELVKELSETERKSHGSNEMPIDHKNIRRRVYDALNVLMAMNIISKEKKDIRWIGLPTNSVQECQHIEEELAQTEQRIQSKRSKVEELIVQILLYKNLMKRNRDRMSGLAAPAQNSAIGLPFIIVNTNKSTTIDCSISSDKSEYVFSFDNAFELHNDIDVLKKMGLDCGLHSGTCSAENLKHAKSLLPKAFGDVLDEIAMAKSLPTVSDSLPHTPIAVHPPSSMTSTPNPTLSPSLTPFTTPTASPHSAAIAVVLAQTSSTLQHSPQAGSPLNHPNPGRLAPVVVPSHTKSGLPGNLPNSNLFSGLSFSQASIANSIRGKTVVPIAAKQTSRSPVSAAKTVLHHRCPSNHPESVSPLIKSSFADTESSSMMHSKSPNAKIVTCSKVSNNEQLHSILQQLQQNPNISKLLSAANSHANGNETPS